MQELINAIKNDSIAMIEKLLKKGLDLNEPIVLGCEYDLEDHDETTPLFFAIRSFVSVEFIKFLVQNGANLFVLDDQGLSAVDVAIKFKRKDIVTFCIEQGFDINISKRKSGITPLMLASCFNDIEMIEILLKNGAEINTIDNHGMSAKDYAKRLGQKSVLEFLEAKGAKFSLYK
jgi:ankyrin repeat protein